MGHETTWKPQSVRNATSASHRHAAFWRNLSLGGTKPESIVKFGCSLVSSLPEERPERPAEPGPMGPSLPFNRDPKRKAEEKAVKRTPENRLHHRFMDPKAYNPADKGRLWRPVYAGRGLEVIAARFWLELPKAGTPGHPKKRRSHCQLEAPYLAPHKKKPKNLEPIWSSWTKPDSCLYRMFGKRGPRWAGRRSCTTVIGVTRFRPSAASLFPLTGNGMVCTSVFTRITLLAGRLLPFWSICCVICAGMWSLFGMAVRFIKERTLKIYCVTPRGCMFTDFRHMLRSSILLNTCGHMGNEIFPTARMKMRIIWDRMCAVPSNGLAALNNFSNLAFFMRNYLGHDYTCIHY
jgi:hypothetical protein